MSTFLHHSHDPLRTAIAEAVPCVSIISRPAPGSAWHLVTGTIQGEPSRSITHRSQASFSAEARISERNPGLCVFGSTIITKESSA